MKKPLSDAEIGQILAESDVHLAEQSKERIKSRLFKPTNSRIGYAYVFVALVVVLFLFTNSNVRSAVQSLSMGVIDQSELPPTPLPEDINNYPMDVFKETPINEADIANEIPFEVLEFSAIPEDMYIDRIRKTSSSHHGIGIMQLYRNKDYTRVIQITQFYGQGQIYVAVDKTKSDIRQLYGNEVACYTFDQEHNMQVVDFAYKNYQITMSSDSSCDDIYKIAKSIKN